MDRDIVSEVEPARVVEVVNLYRAATGYLVRKRQQVRHQMAAGKGEFSAKCPVDSGDVGPALTRVGLAANIHERAQCTNNSKVEKPIVHRQIADTFADREGIESGPCVCHAEGTR